MADNWHVGNATDEADEHRGWLLGHFMAEPGDTSIRATNALEVKWGIHPAGQERPAWTSGDDRTTMVILVSGRFYVNLTVGKVLLALGLKVTDKDRVFAAGDGDGLDASLKTATESRQG